MISTEPQTRPSLLARLKKSPPDEGAWSEFDPIYRQLVIRFVRRQGFSESDAEDVAAQTLVEMVADMPRFEYRPERCRFRSWLFSRARSRMLDACRRSDTRQKVLVELGTDAEGANPLQGAWDAEWERFVVEAAIQTLMTSRHLDPRIAQVLHSLYARQMSAETTAKLLGLKRQDVYRIRSRWHAAVGESVASTRQSLGE